LFILPVEDPYSSGDLVISATDIVAGSVCEYGAMRSLDAMLGRIETEPAADDMLRVVAELGTRHELEVLDTLQDRGVYEVERPRGPLSRTALLARHQNTLAALAGSHGVIYQASFFDGSFHGSADFLIREDSGAWSVNDTKLARTAKAPALLQLAAYADQLEAAGIPVHPEARLILGSGEYSVHALEEIMPQYRYARARLAALLDEHRDDEEPAEWGDTRWAACLTCPDCKTAMEAADDLMLVRRMNRSRRARLIASGTTTMHAFAAKEFPGGDKFLRSLHDQARLQTGLAEPDGTRNGVSWQVLEENTLGLIPAPDAGDIFFDFEGDPLYQDPATKEWGMEYLFGLLEHDGTGTRFTGYTAHDYAQEKEALAAFMGHVRERRAAHPGLHIYHYANYEVTALRRLAARHGILADEVEELVEAGVLFDLYETVKSSLRISERSLSIKKLEPLYMDVGRTGVATAVDSITQYADYRAAAAAGDNATADGIFTAILAYNEYDCLSTLRLRDWLLSLSQ
jgi:uncharacterized protein